MSNYAETEKKINGIRNQYGEVLLRCGITHLMDCGFNTFVEMSDSELQQECDAIREKYRKDVANGKIPIMTDEFQIDIIKVAKELSSLSSTELLVYIQDNIYYNVGQNDISKKDLKQVAVNSLGCIEDIVCNHDIKYFIEIMDSYGVSEDEIRSLGWDEEFDMYYEQQAHDEPDICDD